MSSQRSLLFCRILPTRHGWKDSTQIQNWTIPLQVFCRIRKLIVCKSRVRSSSWLFLLQLMDLQFQKINMIDQFRRNLLVFALWQNHFECSRNMCGSLCKLGLKNESINYFKDLTNRVDRLSKTSIKIKLRICETITTVVDEFSGKRDFLEIKNQRNYMFEFSSLSHSKSSVTLLARDAKSFQKISSSEEVRKKWSLKGNWSRKTHVWIFWPLIVSSTFP